MRGLLRDLVFRISSKRGPGVLLYALLKDPFEFRMEWEG